MALPSDTTDYYGLCVTGVKNRLIQLTSIFPNSYQVTLNRLDINKGGENWALFGIDTFQTTKLDPRAKIVVWQIPFDLYVRFQTEAEALTKFMAVRSYLFNHMHSDPTLSGTKGVENVLLNARSRLLQDQPGDNPNWLIQSMVVAVTQRVVFKF